MPENEVVSLDALEAFISAKHKELKFPKWLEDQSEADIQRRRSSRLRSATIPNVIIYNLFLAADWFLIPDELRLAALLHFLVVTPWILLVGWITGRKCGKFVRESMAGSMPVIIVLQILCGFMLTRSADAGHYQYFVLLVVLFTNTIQRLPFAYATVVSSIIVGLQGIAVFTSGHMSGAAEAIAVVTLAVAAYLTLVSNYYLERDSRRSYLHALRDRLRHAEADAAAKRDALTELGNRHLLTTKLDEIWNAESTYDVVAIVMIDIDHFKLFNDRYGHVAGDLCLKRIAACVISELRGNDDTAIRYGGEEILLLLPGNSLSGATRIAERIRRAVEVLAIPHECPGPRQFVTISAGAAAAPISTISSSELVASADAALYAAKRNGRNQIWPPLVRNGQNSEPESAVVSILRR